MAVHRNGTIIRRDEPGDHIEDGGLARAIGTKEAHGLAPVDAEADAPDDRAAAEALADLGDAQAGVAGNQTRPFMRVPLPVPHADGACFGCCFALAGHQSLNFPPYETVVGIKIV